MRHAKVLELDLGLDPSFTLLCLLLGQLLRLSGLLLLPLSALFDLPPAVLQLLL